MNTKQEILTFLQEHKDELLSRFHVSSIGLFGSFSREEQHESSDIDILVDFDENVTDFYTVKTALKAYLAHSFNRSIDLAREKYLKPYAKEQILKDVIYI
jgi:predicted nucleotidyltransferase